MAPWPPREHAYGPTVYTYYAKQKHPECKKSARPIGSSIVNRYVRPKTLISAEAKKATI